MTSTIEVPSPPVILDLPWEDGWRRGYAAAVLAHDLAAAYPGTPLDEVEVAPSRASDPVTSQLAWRNLSASGARGKVALAFYKSKVRYGEAGLSPKAACRRAKIDGLSSPWKRVSDLKHAGIIAPTGRLLDGDRGRLVEELCITPFGVIEVERTMPSEAAAMRPRGAA